MCCVLACFSLRNFLFLPQTTVWPQTLITGAGPIGAYVHLDTLFCASTYPVHEIQLLSKSYPSWSHQPCASPGRRSAVHVATLARFCHSQ